MSVQHVQSKAGVLHEYLFTHNATTGETHYPTPSPDMFRQEPGLISATLRLKEGNYVTRAITAHWTETSKSGETADRSSSQPDDGGKGRFATTVKDSNGKTRGYIYLAGARPAFADESRQYTDTLKQDHSVWKADSGVFSLDSPNLIRSGMGSLDWYTEGQQGQKGSRSGVLSWLTSFSPQ